MRQGIDEVRPAKQNENDGLRVRQFIIVDADDNDVLNCNTYSNGNAGDLIYKIARQFLTRASIENRDDLTFAYSDSQTRIATDADMKTENQEIVPKYLAGDLVYAIRDVIGGTDCEDADGNDVKWLEIGGTRVWMKV